MSFPRQRSSGSVIFDDIVQPDETFDLSGYDKQNTLGPEITISVNGGEAIEIHTSCSQPIGVGMVFGDFEIIAGASKVGGKLCPLTIGASGIISATDVQIVTNGVLGIPTGYDCDVSGDDQVDSIDVQWVTNAVLGL